MTELAACHTGAEIEVADTDGIVFELVRKVVLALGHGSNEHSDALLRAQALDVITYPHDLGVKTESNFPAIGRKMISDGVLDDLDELLLRSSGTDLMPVKELNHETSKSFERPRDSDSWADFDQNVLCGMDIDLKPSGFVDWGIEEGEQTLPETSACPCMDFTTTHLMCYIRSRFANVSAHLPHDTDVVVAVEQVELFFSSAGTPSRAMRGLVCFQCRITEHDDKALRVFVVAGDGDVLFCDQLR
jgi:hypothetical protein